MVVRRNGDISKHRGRSHSQNDTSVARTVFGACWVRYPSYPIKTVSFRNADSVSRDVYFPMTTQSDVILSRSAWNALWIGFWNELKIWMRLCRLALYFLPLFLTYPLTLLHNDLWKSWLRWMRYTLESCGPAFIKWGQWASTRRDLFPLDVSNELRKLQTESPAHTYVSAFYRNPIYISAALRQANVRFDLLLDFLSMPFLMILKTSLSLAVALAKSTKLD